MQIPHGDIPGNQSGVKVHGNHGKPVPEFSPPHLLLGEHKSQESGTQNRSTCTNHCTGHRHNSGIDQIGNLEHINVVLKVNSLGPENNITIGAQIVGAQSIDDQVVKRINTYNRKHREKQHQAKIKDSVSGRLFYFLIHLLPPFLHNGLAAGYF